MGAPIRSPEAIQVIINNGQHAIGDLGLEIMALAKTGVDNTDPEFRQLQLRITLLRIYLQNVLDNDGNVNLYYQAAANEKKANNLYTGIAKLSGLYGGPAIPLITGDNIPLVYYPSSNTYINQSSEAVPGGVTFENTNVDAPGEVIDRIDVSSSTYAFYIMTVIGTNPGEGSRGTVLLVTWRGSNQPVVTEYAGGDVGGTTAGVTFSAALVSGNIELTLNVPTDNWIVRGSRISFYTISFQNVASQFPTGGAVGQLIRKKSTQDFDIEWFTLTLASITDLLATVTELNYSRGLTGNIQAQINDLVNALLTALADYLLLTGGTMSGNIAMGSNKITGLAAATNNGDAVRFQQIPSLNVIMSEILITEIMSLPLTQIIAINETKQFVAGANGARIYLVQFIGGAPSGNITISDGTNEYELLSAGTVSKKNYINTTDIPGIPSETGGNGFFYPVGAGRTVSITSDGVGTMVVVTYIDL